MQHVSANFFPCCRVRKFQTVEWVTAKPGRKALSLAQSGSSARRTFAPRKALRKCSASSTPSMHREQPSKCSSNSQLSSSESRCKRYNSANSDISSGHFFRRETMAPQSHFGYTDFTVTHQLHLLGLLLARLSHRGFRIAGFGVQQCGRTYSFSRSAKTAIICAA
jgi:hypothetical protein